MTMEQARKIFINRGINDSGIFNGNDWREACIKISDWMKEHSIDGLIEKLEKEVYSSINMDKTIKNKISYTIKEYYEDSNVQNINLISKEEFDKMYDINNGFNNTYLK